MKFPICHCIHTSLLTEENYSDFICYLVSEGYENKVSHLTYDLSLMWNWIGVGCHGDIDVWSTPHGFMEPNSWMDHRDVQDSYYPNVLDKDFLDKYLKANRKQEDVKVKTSQPNNAVTKQRITEQDARELVMSYYDSSKVFDVWVKGQGAAILAKLNGGLPETREPDYKVQRDELLALIKHFRECYFDSAGGSIPAHDRMVVARQELFEALTKASASTEVKS